MNAHTRDDLVRMAEEAGERLRAEQAEASKASSLVWRDAEQKRLALIAAAPDLLAALEAVERVLDASLEAAGVLRAAIAKARGTP